jgi:hypothetical protein
MVLWGGMVHKYTMLKEVSIKIHIMVIQTSFRLSFMSDTDPIQLLYLEESPRSPRQPVEFYVVGSYLSVRSLALSHISHIPNHAVHFSLLDLVPSVADGSGAST